MSIAMKLLQWHIYLYVYNPNNVCPHSFSPGQVLAQGLATRNTANSISYLKANPKSEARTLAVQHGHRVALGFQSSKQKEHRRRLFSTVTLSSDSTQTRAGRPTSSFCRSGTNHARCRTCCTMACVGCSPTLHRGIVPWRGTNHKSGLSEDHSPHRDERASPCRRNTGPAAHGRLASWLPGNSRGWSDDRLCSTAGARLRELVRLILIWMPTHEADYIGPFYSMFTFRPSIPCLLLGPLFHVYCWAFYSMFTFGTSKHV